MVKVLDTAITKTGATAATVVYNMPTHASGDTLLAIVNEVSGSPSSGIFVPCRITNIRRDSTNSFMTDFDVVPISGKGDAH